MENRKKMARAAILAATIAGGVLMFAQPFEAQAYSGGTKTKSCYLTYYSNGDTSVSCANTGSECASVGDCKGCW